MKNVTLFAQIMQTVDRISFTKLVNQHGNDKHAKGITSWTHQVTMLFCQLIPFAMCVMARFKQTRFKIKSKILLLYSTTISFCLSLYDWAKFR